MLSAAILSLALPLLAAAHGTVQDISFDGKSYKGPPPATDGSGSDSIIRQVSDVGPTTVDSPDLNCGLGAKKPAADVADVKPGASVLFDWKSNGGTNWIHEIGPVLTYMAKCDGDCSSFDATKAKWFKIQEDGLDNGNWAMAAINKGQPAKATIPKNLAPGEYLLRSELIALHTAVTEGGAEFFPSCSQIKVSGSGTGAPKDSETVQFPGGYKATDKGLLIDVYDMGKAAYSLPGPKIASFVGGGSSGGDAPAPSETEVAPSSTKDFGSPAASTKSSPDNAAAPSPTTDDANASPSPRPAEPAASSSTKTKSRCAASSKPRRRRSVPGQMTIMPVSSVSASASASSSAAVSSASASATGSVSASSSRHLPGGVPTFVPAVPHGSTPNHNVSSDDEPSTGPKFQPRKVSRVMRHHRRLSH